MESALNYTKKILKKYELKAKKSLGQNFLIDDRVVSDIIAGSGHVPGDNVLEVGPGTGVLTRLLAETAGSLRAVELDKTLSMVLQEEFRERDNVKIIYGDALKLKAEELCPGGAPLQVIANLPYYITSPLINHFLEQRRYISRLTLMVQKEVADRIVAAPGTKSFGILSIAVQVYCEARILFTVPRQSFLPAPNVESAVIRLDILSEPLLPYAEEDWFFKVVKGAFNQRRKTLANSLSNAFGWSKDNIAKAMFSLGLNQNVRAEELSINEFRDLAKALAP